MWRSFDLLSCSHILFHEFLTWCLFSMIHLIAMYKQPTDRSDLSKRRLLFCHECLSIVILEDFQSRTKPLSLLTTYTVSLCNRLPAQSVSWLSFTVCSFDFSWNEPTISESESWTCYVFFKSCTIQAQRSSLGLVFSDSSLIKPFTEWLKC